MRDMIHNSRVQRWLIFGVGASMAPLIFTILYQWAAGQQFFALCKHYTPDFLLVTLAISSGVLNSSTIGPWKKGSALLAFVSLLFCFGFYSWLCGLDTEPQRLFVIMVGGLAAFFLNTYLGIRSENISPENEQARSAKS